MITAACPCGVQPVVKMEGTRPLDDVRWCAACACYVFKTEAEILVFCDLYRVDFPATVAALENVVLPAIRQRRESERELNAGLGDRLPSREMETIAFDPHTENPP